MNRAAALVWLAGSVALPQELPTPAPRESSPSPQSPVERVVDVVFVQIRDALYRVAQSPHEVRARADLTIRLSGDYRDAGLTLLHRAVALAETEGGPGRVEDFRWGLIGIDATGSDVVAAFFARSYRVGGKLDRTVERERDLILELRQLVDSLLLNDGLMPDERERLK